MLFNKKIFKSEFFRNSLTLFSGSLASQLILLTIFPILTRLYPIEIFGIYFVYSAIVITLSTLASLKYELAIVLPDNDEEAVNLLILSLITTFIVSLTIFLIIILFFDFITNLLGEKQIGKWLYFVPLSIFFLGIFQSFNYWNNRKKDYKIISFAKISKSISSSAVQLGGGSSTFQKTGLIYGLLFGQFSSAFFIAFKTIKNYKSLYTSISLKNIISAAKKYKDIPLFNTTMAVLNSLSNQLPIFLLTKFYGLTTASFYGLANRFISTPMGLVGQSVGQVFYQEASNRYNIRTNFYAFIKNTYIKLFKTALLPFLIMAVFAPFLFKLLFGAKWEIAGIFAQILIPWLIIMFLNSPITFIITILNKQKQMVVYDILLFILRFLSLYLGFKIYNDAYISIIFFSLTGLIFNIFLMFYLLIIAKRAEIEK